MNLLPKSSSEFTHLDYWNQFFKKRGQKAFEWYGEYPELCGILHKYIRPRDKILVIGCGNSGLSSDLYNVGYKQIMNIDMSSVVIKQMQVISRNKPGLEYRRMDATDMAFKEEAFSVVLDKGTLDALMPDSAPETMERIEKLYSEIDRVLSPLGRFVCVSLLQPHILRSLASMSSARGWMLRVCRCQEAERTSEDGGTSLPVFIVVCTKLKKMPNAKPVMEFCQSGESAYRVSCVDDLLSTVKSLQDMALVCGGLRRCSVAGSGEVSVELSQPNDPEQKSRYTITVTDSPRLQDVTRMKYAAFVVPQGREREWLFGSPDGRQNLLASSGYDRLAVIQLHRGQHYESLAAVQSETADIVLRLAPRHKNSGPEPKIPFLSVGSDLGRVVEVARGTSEFSGDYVVEDVEGDNKQLFRRLIFLSNQMTVQSEARLKTEEEKFSVKKVVDVSYLACEHHSYMTLGVSMVASEDKSFDILVIGLGGGGLCTYIRACFQTVNITAVDIDPVVHEIATKHFGLNEDGKLQVVIEDGLNYLKNAVNKGVKFAAVLFDIDNKDTRVGVSCPPLSFLEPDTFSAVSQTLDDSGVFVLNLVCRAEEIRQQTWTKLRNVFKEVTSVKLTEEVNEEIFCFKNKPAVTIKDAVKKLNSTVRNLKLQDSDLIDTKELMSMIRVD